MLPKKETTLSQPFQLIALFTNRNTRAATGALAATALLLFPTLTAHAVPITYTYSGIASGSVGATPINSAEFLITFVADTDNILSGGAPAIQLFTEDPGFPFANPLPTFSWGGVSGTFTEPADTFYAIGIDSDGVTATLFNGQSSNLMFAFTDPAFNGYDLISPFSFFGVPQNLTPPPYATDAGDFEFTDVEDEVAFNAVGGIVVPEANTFALALPALGMLGAIVIRRKK